MIGRLISKTWLAVGVLVAALFLLAGCAARTIGVEDRPPSGLVLEYKMPQDQVLRYHTTGEMKEVGEVMGQSLESNTTSEGTYLFLSKGSMEKNHLLEVTIESMGLQISSTQGEFSPDMKTVIGKSFDMVLSPLGTEVDTSGAEAIQYDIMGSSRNLASGFKVFFPDLPGKPVEIGDTWPAGFSISDKNDTTDIRIEMQGTSTLEGFESVDGMECARIKTAFTGTISGEGNQQGADIYFSGDAEGTDLWYFAVKEGLFIKMTSDAFIDMVIDVTGPQNLTIPTTQTRKAQITLVK